MIKIHSVSKNYNDKYVLKDISVDIYENTITSIIGPNGAGKSTLLSVMSRLMPMSKGEIIVDGININSSHTDKLAKILSILRQENTVTSRLRVWDLVAFGRYPHSKGRLTISDKEQIENALNYLNISQLRERFIDELSGGQRQRVFLAMVICQDTKYILLDEPLNSLDLRHAVQTMKLLRRAVSELNKTIILVIHDINFASYYSDRIIALSAGKVLFDGLTDDVLTENNLSDLYGMHITTHHIGEKKLLSFYE